MVEAPTFVKLIDAGEQQQVVLAAALAGDTAVLDRLPELAPGLDEPYRSAAAEILRLQADGYVDAAVLRAALAGRRLARPANAGRGPLTGEELVNLLAGTPTQPGQAAAYADVL